MKWRFLNNEQSNFQLGVYPRILLPTRDRARGLGGDRSAFVFPAVAQKSWDKWTVYGNVGFWWQTASETRNYSYAGAVLERAINERLMLGAELFGNSPKKRGSRADAAFNLGGAWKLSDMSISYLQVDATSSAIHERWAYVGLDILTK